MPILCFITDKPKLLSVTPGNMTVTENEDVSLGAVVEGNPAPYVAWVSQNGSVLQNKTEQFNYTITNITRKDRGKYQCVATNPVDNHFVDFWISVQCKSNSIAIMYHKNSRPDKSPAFHGQASMCLWFSHLKIISEWQQNDFWCSLQYISETSIKFCSLLAGGDIEANSWLVICICCMNKCIQYYTKG